jgi:hypothetical protein
VYGRHSELFGSSLGSGILMIRILIKTLHKPSDLELYKRRAFPYRW